MLRIVLPTLMFCLLVLSGCDMFKLWQLEKAVKEALAKDTRTGASVYEVTAAEDGTVAVAGEVSSPEEQQAMREIVAKVPGVTKVLDNTHLYEPGSGMMQDTVVTGPYM